jgi:tellurite resistance protein TerC
MIPTWVWIAFACLVASLLAVDLFSHRGERGTTRRNAILWSIVWIGAGLLFNVLVWLVLGGDAAQEYLAAYLIEKGLSLDNLFVFLLIFQTLKISPQYQHRVLFWGIFGALVFRGIFIFLGTSALERWQWLSVIFGALLLRAAWSAWRKDPKRRKHSKVVSWLSDHMPLTKHTQGREFIVEKNGKHVATPLLLALVAIELTDIMFAIDSVPAALSVSHNGFIIYSSNVFAILGLRALYTALAEGVKELRYLHYGLAGVLGFAGLKLMLHPWIHIPALASIGVICAVIGVAVWLSLRWNKKETQ